MRRKEESMKHKKLRRQVHDNIEVAHIPEINDSPIPRSKRRVVEFNVENRMNSLQVTIDNDNNFLLGCLIESRNISIRSKLNVESQSQFKQQLIFTRMSD